MYSIPTAVYEDLVKRYGVNPAVQITAPADVLQIKQVAYLSKKSQEEFLVISLDSASHVIKTRSITKGLLNHSCLSIRVKYSEMQLKIMP